MEITIRPEQPKDYRKTEEIAREAFWNWFAPGCDEHYLLHSMRSNPDFVAPLSFVALQNNQPIGVIAYAKAYIKTPALPLQEILMFGPLCVLPACQRLGIGAALVRHSLQATRQMGYSAVSIYGDPAYYRPLGFVPAKRFGIKTPNGNYLQVLMVYPLHANALPALGGVLFESPLYHVDAKKAAIFDQSFPVRQKQENLPSQKRFLQLVQDQIPFPE
ncbi:MAG: GNAT family N-acetyltransferase [Oscillospiraceae bacterium]